jgi:hypothetical protein
MHNLLEDLKAYYANTPQSKIDADWNKYAKYDEVGPKVSDLLSHFETHFSYIENQELENQILKSNIKTESPKVSGFFFVHWSHEKSSILS